MELRKITQKELDGIIKRHQHWLREDCKGWENMEADLSYTDLSGLNFSNANMRLANFVGTVTSDATFDYANLKGAVFIDADLRGSSFFFSSLDHADFRGADMTGCSFVNATLYAADLRLAKNPPYVPLACPETGGFIGYKKAIAKESNTPKKVEIRNGVFCGYWSHAVIVTLVIPSDAKRSSATSRKCRCDKATVIDIRSYDGTEQFSEACSALHDPGLTYRIGETVSVDDFDEDRWNECSTGIHFFINRQEAVDF